MHGRHKTYLLLVSVELNITALVKAHCELHISMLRVVLDVRNCGLATLLLLSKQTSYRKIFGIVHLPSIYALRKDR